MMKRFLCLSLVVGLLLSGCGGKKSPLGPSEPSLTSEQIAQIETVSKNVNNVLLQADDPTSLEALEAAKQAALSQSVVEQAFVVEDELVVKYKNGGFEVWTGDIPRITPPTDIAELHKVARSILAKSLAIKDSVGTRQAVLINCLYDDPAFAAVKDVFDIIEELLITKGFVDVERLDGGRANLSTLKLLSNYSVIVKVGHGGRGIGFFRYPYNTQTGELWSYGEGFLSDAIYNEDWRAGRIVYRHTPWGKGDEKTRKKNSKLFFGVTGKFWSHYYKNSPFNNGLFFNLACSGSLYESYMNGLFGVGIKGYTGWSKETTISPYAAWWMLALMAEGKTLKQAYDELPDDYKYQDKYDSRLWVGKDDGEKLTLGGPILQGPQITITSPKDGSTITTKTCAVKGKITPWQTGSYTIDGSAFATIVVNSLSSDLEVDNTGSFSRIVKLKDGENIIRVSVVTIAVSSKEIRVTRSTLPEWREVMGITFVSIPGGTFRMGDVENVGLPDEKPVHTVTLSGFEMSVYEITNAQYAAYLNAAKASGTITATSSSVMGTKGAYSNQRYIYLDVTVSGWPDVRCWITYSNNTFSVVSDHENWPVEWVTWYGAKAFALYYGLDLPTEAEWEYACRGGHQYKYGTADGTISTSTANYGGTGIWHPVAVGSYPANPYGLYDMSGNVWEWCHDWYGTYPSGSVNNPTGAQTGSSRVLRGGGWNGGYGLCRSAYRSYNPADYRCLGIGFRVVCRASPQNY